MHIISKKKSERTKSEGNVGKIIHQNKDNTTKKLTKRQTTKIHTRKRKTRAITEKYKNINLEGMKR